MTREGRPPDCPGFPAAGRYCRALAANLGGVVGQPGGRRPFLLLGFGGGLHLVSAVALGTAVRCFLFWSSILKTMRGGLGWVPVWVRAFRLRLWRLFLLHRDVRLGGLDLGLRLRAFGSGLGSGFGFRAAAGAETAAGLGRGRPEFDLDGVGWLRFHWTPKKSNATSTTCISTASTNAFFCPASRFSGIISLGLHQQADPLDLGPLQFIHDGSGTASYLHVLVAGDEDRWSGSSWAASHGGLQLGCG